MKKTRLPVTDSIEELARFWDTHDATDFDDEFEEVTEPLFVRKPIIRHVKRVTYKKDYELRLEFTDGVVKDVDFQKELHGEVFESLRDPEFFKRVVVNEETGTIEWPNGADFAPEFLYKVGKKVKQVA